MWAKVNILLVICMLGLFLAPSRVFACHLTPEKTKQEEKMSCCSENDQDLNATDNTHGVNDTHKNQELKNTDKDRDVEDTEGKDCCNDVQNEKDHGDDCGKRCSGKSCRTFMQYSPMIAVYGTGFIPLWETGQLKLYTLYKQPFCADAYFSIWQPPKIA